MSTKSNRVNMHNIRPPHMTPSTISCWMRDAKNGHRRLCQVNHWILGPNCSDLTNVSVTANNLFAIEYDMIKIYDFIFHHSSHGAVDMADVIAYIGRCQCRQFWQRQQRGGLPPVRSRVESEHFRRAQSLPTLAKSAHPWQHNYRIWPDHWQRDLWMGQWYVLHATRFAHRPRGQYMGDRCCVASGDAIRSKESNASGISAGRTISTGEKG